MFSGSKGAQHPKDTLRSIYMVGLPDAVILCGGAGLRLASVIGPDTPKPMAGIAGRPFLELLLRQLQRHGFRRVILAVGYQKEVISSAFGERAVGLDLIYSAESSPLGTGGALRKAANLVETSAALIINGDSYTPVDLHQFVAGHCEAQHDGSMVLVPAGERSDCGSVQVDPSGKLVGFQEKPPSGCAHYANGGIYLLSRRILRSIPPDIPISLEREILPLWLDEGHHINAFFCPDTCVDIGTPERYRAAQDILARVELTAPACHQKIMASVQPRDRR
jgi:NDP-sugar pyrophosphorylase family protein